MEFAQAEATLRELLKEVDFYYNISMTLQWDMRVNLPPKAAEYRGDSIGFLSEKSYLLKTDPRMKEAAEAVLASGKADQLLTAMAKKALAEYNKYTTIPKKLFTDFAAHNLKAELVWQDARATNNYDMFKDYMWKEFDYKRQFAEVMGYGDNVMTYLMGEWERGMTEEKMDKLFGDLKAFLVPLIKEIQAKKPEGDRESLYGHYPIEKQRELVHEMLTQIGFDFAAGRVDESAHPYTTANTKYDIRLTTRYFENDFTNACISSTHETGHALYRQNLKPEFEGTTINSSTSMGMDEGQSRYLENIIGRSQAFWTWLLPMAQKKFPELKKFTPEEFYRLLNTVRPGALRLDADELTYNLHIIIRYEIEKMIFNGEIGVDDVPKVWNDKYEEYLGIRPKNDAEGILQDMHWASGYIGYFQNYVIGNFYDGHLYKKMKQDIPDMYEKVARGEFQPIIDWQRTHIHELGDLYTPAETLKLATGDEELSAQPFIDYLKEKYTALFNL